MPGDIMKERKQYTKTRHKESRKKAFSDLTQYFADIKGVNIDKLPAIIKSVNTNAKINKNGRYGIYGDQTLSLILSEQRK